MTRLPRPDAILFDLGDTLLIEEGYDIGAGVRALLAEPSIPTCEGAEASDRLTGELEAATSRTHAGASEEFRVRDWLRGVLEEDSSGRHLDDAELVLWRACARLSPAAGVHELLDELAAEQLPLAAVSNAVFSARILAWELERHGLRRCFPCVVSSADVGHRKPDPAPFRQALRRVGVEPGRSWFVGDSFANDVTGAEALGLTPIWLDASGAAPPGAAFHHRVATLPELLDLYLSASPSTQA